MIISRKAGSVSLKKGFSALSLKELGLAGSAANMSCVGVHLFPEEVHPLCAWPGHWQLDKQRWVQTEEDLIKKASWHSDWARAVRLINLLTPSKDKLQSSAPVLPTFGFLCCFSFCPLPWEDSIIVPHTPCSAYRKNMSHLVPSLACHCDLLQ